MNAGRIEDKGASARVYRQRRSHFAAAFMGEVNMFPGRVRGHDGAGLAVETGTGTLVLPGAAPAGAVDLVTLLVRPEHFREPGTVALGTATIEDLAFFGTHIGAHCRLGTLRLVAHFPQGASVAPGDPVALGVAPDLVAVLPGHPA